MTIAERLKTAIAHHQAGRLAEAEAIYRQILTIDSAHADALHLLGTVAIQTGHPQAAVELIQRAIRWQPSRPDYYLALAEACRRQGQLVQAAQAARHAIKLDSNFAQAHASLGQICKEQGELKSAADSFRQAIRLRPDDAEPRIQLGVVLVRQGNLDEAELSLARAIRNAPRDARALYNLGTVRQAQGKFDDAAASYKATLECDPNHADAHNNLGAMLQRSHDLARAETHYREAIRIQPNDARAHNNLAICLQSQGQLDHAADAYRRAVSLAPHDAYLHSNLLYLLNYQPESTPDAVFAEHRAWAERHADPLTAQAAPHRNDRTAGRRLRLGYVSAHFRAHAVNYFVEPILAAHDHQAFEVFCYSHVAPAVRDATTERLKGCADQWREIHTLGDVEAAELVRADQIDVLVDLSGHIGGNRLLVFARKPAPIQVTYIGYQNTTGMLAMDYRLTDAWSDPPGRTDKFHTEKLVRLDEAFFCYQPLADSPAIEPCETRAEREVVFGSFNNFAKITPRVLEAWGAILAAVPGSRLVMLAMKTDWLQKCVLETFGRFGISAERISIVGRRPARDFLKLISTVDIALDPFPMNGHTTTCDCLWMGVPVVSLAGDRYASRFGASALAQLGLRELIAESREEYVQIASGLAMNIERRAQMRCDMRAMMSRSGLTDAKRFTEKFERVLRELWADYCARG